MSKGKVRARRGQGEEEEGGEVGGGDGGREERLVGLGRHLMHDYIIFAWLTVY